MKTIALLLTILLLFAPYSETAKEANVGHLLGGDISKYPGNTLEALSESISKNIHKHKKFKYYEFDINETKDHRLIVFHDRKIKGIGKIRKTNYNVISQYRIDNKYRIPLLSEVLYKLQMNYKGHVVAEIKRLSSDIGRDKFINLIEEYKAKGALKIDYFAFKSHFKKSFPSKESRIKYCKRMKFVMKARSHKTNLCKEYLR